MKQETLKKAKNLENDIIEYNNLLLSRGADYHTMLIKINCAYSNDRNEYYGRGSKEGWNKMLDVVAEERLKTCREFEALTDDSADGMTAEASTAGQGEWKPTEVYKEGDMVTHGGIEYECHDGKSESAAMPQKESWTDKFIRSLDRLMSWLLYSLTFFFLLGVAGLQLSTREAVAYSLMLGLITGSINNLERVIRELFGKKEG